MNPLRTVSLFLGILCLASAHYGPMNTHKGYNRGNSIKNNLRATDFMSASELESMPPMEHMTFESFEKMNLQDGAEMMEKMYHLSQAGRSIQPSYAPNPSEMSAYYMNQDNEKVSFKLSDLPTMAMAEDNFANQELTIYITGMPEKSETVQKATRKMMEAYMQRYRANKSKNVRNSNSNNSNESQMKDMSYSEENQESKERNQESNENHNMKRQRESNESNSNESSQESNENHNGKKREHNKGNRASTENHSMKKQRESYQNNSNESSQASNEKHNMKKQGESNESSQESNENHNRKKREHNKGNRASNENHGVKKQRESNQNNSNESSQASNEHHNMKKQGESNESSQESNENHNRKKQQESYKSNNNRHQPTGKLIVVEMGNMLNDMRRYVTMDVEKTGMAIGDILVQMTDMANVPHEIVHVIGAQMGAHIAGAAGRQFTRRTGHKMRRITGLDPSKIFAQTDNALRGLARGDAQYVDVIHTSAYGMGMPTRSGNADFYPNGPSEGVPGAENVVEATMRAVRYYAESVIPGNERNFPAVAATSMQQYKDMNGNGKRVYMGINADYNAEGDFMLQVNSKSPFGRRAPAHKQHNYHNMHTPWKTNAHQH